MKSIYYKTLAGIFLSVFAVTEAASQCNNLDFEMGNFTNWTGAIGTVDSWSGSNVSTWSNTNIISPGRHTILTAPGQDPNCYDPSTGQLASCMTFASPNGSNYIVQLGNSSVNNQTERLRYTIPVTAANPSFTYSYAVVLEDPSHTSIEQPRFDIRVYDQNGVQIPGACGQYSVYAGSDPNFITNPFSAPNPNVKYKCWTTVGVDLVPYIGTNVTIEFQTADCTLGGHFGYAYLDLSCIALQATVGYCPGDTNALVVAPAGFVNYQWYDTAGVAIPGPDGTNDSLMLNNVAIGSQYTVVMTSISGCQATMIATVQYSSLSSTVAPDPACYGGSNGTATVSATGGAYPYTYTWSNGDTQATADSLAPGQYTVFINSGGCSTTDTVIITQAAPPMPTLTQHYYCSNATTTTIVGPSTAVSHQWYDNNGNIIGGATNDTLQITGISTGQVYTDSVVDGFGCISAYQVQIFPSPLSANVTASSNCYGTSNPTATATVFPSGGSSGYTYLWDNGQISQTASSLSTGTHWVQVTSGGCTVTDTFVVVQGAPPTPFTQTYSFCQGDVVNISAPAGYTVHQWYDASGNLIPGATSQTYSVNNPVNNQVYRDTMRNSQGCMFFFNATFNETFVTTNTSQNNNPCWGYSQGTATVMPSGGPSPYSYSWNTSPVQNGSTATGLAAGTYIVTVTSGACVATDTVLISEPPRIDTATIYAYFCRGDDSVMVVGLPGMVSYDWFSPADTILNTSLNLFLVTNPYVGMPVTAVYYPGSGCPIYDHVTLNYNTQFPFFTPDSLNNVFTPNGDGKNDYFIPYKESFSSWPDDFQVDQYTLKVYDRWGILVYETSDPNSKGWDGKKDGKQLAPEVYYWISTFTSRCSDDEPIVSKGFVHLLQK